MAYVQSTGRRASVVQQNSIRSSLFLRLPIASVLLTIVVVAWNAFGSDPAIRVAPPVNHSAVIAPSPKPEVVGTIAPRLSRTRFDADPFSPHSWTQASSKPLQVPQLEPNEAGTPVQAAGPPPLPFRYLGRLSDGSQRFVFLAAGEGVAILREGDLVDATHRVERIDATGITIEYLPRSLLQRLPYDGGPVETPMQPDYTAAPPALAWDGPTQAMAGSEFSIALSLPGMAVHRADMTLRYDPWALELIDSTAQTLREKGQVTLRFDAGGDGAFLAELRFRVVATASVSTSITVEQMTLHDADGVAMNSVSTSPHVVLIKL